MCLTRLHLSLVLAIAILAGGCGGNGGGAAADCPPSDASTGARNLVGKGSDVTYLTGLRVEPGPCGDRIVFEFRDRAPGARVDYRPREEALLEDGSGDRLEAEGEAFLVVRLEPAATAEAHGDELEFTYTGPRRLEPDGAQFVQEIVKTGDFEAAVSWAIGASEERPFSVRTSGRRITIELA